MSHHHHDQQKHYNFENDFTTTHNNTIKNNNQMIWITIQSQLCNIIQNWYCQRRYSPSYSKRIEGHTEKWNNNTNNTNNNTATNNANNNNKDTNVETTTATKNDADINNKNDNDWNDPSYWNIENIEENISTSSISTSSTIRLYQYRIAWLEQFALCCVSNINYIVMNSQYAVTEVTGPLPCIQDVIVTPPPTTPTPTPTPSTDSSSSSSIPSKNHMIMIGRNQFWKKRKQQSGNNIASDAASLSDSNVASSTTSGTNDKIDNNNNMKYHHKNGILKYLYDCYQIDFHEEIMSISKQLQQEKDESLLLSSKSYTLCHIVEHILNRYWIHLRYCNNHSYNNEWERFYRIQSLKASSLGNNNNNSYSIFSSYMFSLFAYYQTWSERIYYTSTTACHPSSSFDDIIQEIRNSYDIFEQQLKLIVHHQKQKEQNKEEDIHQQDNTTTNNKCYCILGTMKPSLIDLLFFDHIMNSLTDLHLVIIIADYPYIIQYIQNIWDQYFAIDTTTNHNNNIPTTTTTQTDTTTDTTTQNSKLPDTWKEWNYYQNSMNPFNTFPLFHNHSNNTELNDKDSDDNDQQLPWLKTSTNLYDMLQDFKKKRSIDRNDVLLFSNSASTSSSTSTTGHTWYRWRMGDSFYPTYNNDDDNNTNKKNNETGSTTATSTTMNETIIRQQQLQQQRDYRRNDEIWIVTISVITTTVLLGFALINNNKQQQ